MMKTAKVNPRAKVAEGRFKIFYDDLQEGNWFKGLHPSFGAAKLIPINGNNGKDSPISKALEYDRPDIILVDDDRPILVIERTIEVPTGHNVGQRFARLAAAAEARIPLVYFGPYMARKHGGLTEGPRYMNLRLFYALDILAQLNKAAVTTINWPVDNRCELLRTPEKDARMKEYIDLFLAKYKKHGLQNINEELLRSDFQKEQAEEREKFINDYVRSPERYDAPPPSVLMVDARKFIKRRKIDPSILYGIEEIVLYKIGMNYVRSDPYTGTGMLYRYLYVLGEKSKKRALVLHLPYITKAMWGKASKTGGRKDVRLFKHIADLIVLKNSIGKGEHS